jgi:hypothetical protein
MDFDITEIQKALDFLNWKMIVANGVLLMGWVQLIKPYLGDPTWKGFNIPLVLLVSLFSSMLLSHFVFDVSGVKHTETIALFHGFASFVLSSLGYELLSGKFLSMRSKDQMVKPPDPPAPKP